MPRAHRMKFIKTYTRDVSFIMQETWFYGQTKGLKKTYGISNPHKPINIYCMNDGAIEVWQNKAAVDYLKDEIYARNIADKKFLSDSIVWYKNLVQKLKPMWDRGFMNTIEELKKFIKIAFKADTAFIPFYYSAVDERTPKLLRDQALAVRDQDVFFDRTDKVIRESLLKIHPRLVGYEATVLTNEVEKPPELPILAKRHQHCVFIPNNVLEPITLEQFIVSHPKYECVFDRAEGNSADELRGQIGQVGRARGLVRTMRRKSQIIEMRKGEILVMPMTTPDFIPAMKKAAAIVTDEGGITCHAAIVARELGIPCVIGTKIATKIFKDGDRVEVDAIKGIVRKI